MRTRRGGTRCVVSIAVLATTALATTAMPAVAQSPIADPIEDADDATPVDSTVLGEIVVTATRRETSLQRIPASIAVIDGTDQRDRGQQRLEDIQLSVPNVSFANTSNASQLFIRGVGNTFLNAGGDPGVAFYQDGAYVSDQRSTNTSLFDIDRVEILRGPQGALYGRNAVGGAINIISARPTRTLTGRVDALVGDRGRFESEGFVSGPLDDQVAARLSYQFRRYDGYLKNELAGQSDAPDRFDDLKSEAVRGQIAADLPGDGKISLLISHYNQHDAGPGLSVVPQPGIVYPAEALFGARPLSDPRRVKAQVGYNRLRVTTLNASLVQPIGGVTFTGVGNYRRSRQNFLSDCDSTEAEACRYFGDTFSNDYYAEAYLSSDDSGPFRWIVGGTYGRLKQRQRIRVPWLSLLSYFAPDAPTDVPFPITYDAGGELDVESYAAYVDLRYQFSNMLAATGQLRYTRTEKTAIEFQSIPEFGVGVTGFPNQLKNEHTPYKLGLEAQLTPDILFYGIYATANKDGAINIGSLQTRPVRKETVRSFELGAKTSFLNRRLQVNGAVFTSRYDNLQIAQVVQLLAVLGNAPKASIKGGEFEIVALPVPDLRLGLTFGYLDARFDQLRNSPTIPGAAPGPEQDLAGNRLPYVPETSAVADIRYNFAPLAGYKARLGAQVSYRSSVFFNEFNDRLNGQGSGTVVNLDAGFGPDRSSWEVYGYVRNLFDRTYQTGSTIYSGLLGAEKAVSYAPPRTVAVGVRYSF